jgi:mannose-6-phosphate isomerase-like protein (cupin superfamily)
MKLLQIAGQDQSITAPGETREVVMARVLFDEALAVAQKLHADHPALAAFVDWDPNVVWADLPPAPQAAAQALAGDARLVNGPQIAGRAAFTALGPVASWLRSYTDDQIFPGFNARFGSYPLVGPHAHFRAQGFAAYVLYSDAALWYPWHDHPAEEIYLVIAGEAEFMVDGETSRILGPGETCFHASNQSHAMQTHDSPVMAMVLWRGNLETRPRLTTNR